MKARQIELLTSQARTLLQIEIDRESVPQARLIADELREQEIDVSIKKWRNKRSLAANAYCWTLLNALAAKIRIPPVEIYREQIKNIGDNSVIVPIKDEAVDTWCKNWEERGIGWVTDKLESKLEGYVNIVCYYGSSTYDTAQMSRLIELVIVECKEQGIETATPDEISRMLELWNG